MADDTEKTKQGQSHLLPIRHPKQDFFIADLFDAITFRDDIASMEYPLFALKSADTRIVEYELNNFKTTIRPTVKIGRATIHDKDIWIYCISKLRQAIFEGKEVSRTVRFTIYDYLVTTNRTTSGKDYENTKLSLDRLSGTRIKTEIETDKKREAYGFGLVDSWKIIEEKDGRMIRVEVTLPDWLFRSVTSNAVLKISPDYFRLRKPLDRRIYELSRKHCGNQKEFLIGLDKLYSKSGSTASKREFRRAIKALVNSNELPDYKIQYLADKDQVMFINRHVNSVREVRDKLEKKRKRELIEQARLNSLANNKEIKQSVVSILNFIGHNFPDKKYPIFKTEILTEKKLQEYLHLFDANYLLQKIIEFIDFDFMKECKNPEAYFYRIVEKAKEQERTGQ